MKETDRELLELAAKAQAVSLKYDENSKTFWRNVPETNRYAAHETPWNPLSDDGDALRLAVKLHLCIEHGNYEARVFVQWEDTAISLIEYKTEQNESAATRRAIVLAAAMLGKDMP